MTGKKWSSASITAPPQTNSTSRRKRSVMFHRWERRSRGVTGDPSPHFNEIKSALSAHWREQEQLHRSVIGGLVCINCDHDITEEVDVLPYKWCSDRRMKNTTFANAHLEVTQGQGSVIWKRHCACVNRCKRKLI